MPGTTWRRGCDVRFALHRDQHVSHGDELDYSYDHAACAQRNVSTAILVSAQNFSGTNTLSFVLVAAILLRLILLPTARQLGARTQAPEASSSAQAGTVSQ